MLTGMWPDRQWSQLISREKTFANCSPYQHLRFVGVGGSGNSTEYPIQRATSDGSTNSENSLQDFMTGLVFRLETPSATGCLSFAKGVSQLQPSTHVIETTASVSKAPFPKRRLLALTLPFVIAGSIRP